jgi:cytochrome P450
MMVNRPEVIEELLVTKNKYYDKHPASLEIIGVVLGDSILFAKSDLKWSQKRKVISTALYKEKLRGMIEIIKNVTIKTL